MNIIRKGTPLMKYKKYGDCLAVRIDRSEEIVSSLRGVCSRENIRFASVTGIGAAGHTVVGLYHVAEKKFVSNTFDGELEMTSLTGSVTEKDGKPYLHLHASFAGPDGKAVGGHLVEAVVSGTAEIFLRAVPGAMDRRTDPVTGLNLFDI